LTTEASPGESRNIVEPCPPSLPQTAWNKSRAKIDKR
jgi:hypothetical protein